MKLLVTGGAGFIGSALVRYVIRETQYTVVNIDKLTYAGNPDNLEEVGVDARYVHERVDICDRNELQRVFHYHRPDAVIHLAAESHVDRSIQGPGQFIQTNIVGTYNMLEEARLYWRELSGSAKASFRFHHVSTDEVYGDLAPRSPAFTETNNYAPSSPYSASKAASDHLVRAWHRTYGLPVLLTNCSNNYGPYQFPEKLIPLTILNALEDKPLPVYGRGRNIRDWLFVEDHVRALLCVLSSGEIGQTYNIGGRAERTNLNVVRTLCAILDELSPRSVGPYANLIQFVEDRPGHDHRYAIDDTRIATELGWQPQESFETGLRQTVQWYLSHSDWVGRVRSGDYQQWMQANYAHRKVSQ